MLMLSVKGGAAIKPRFSYNKQKLAHLLWREAVHTLQLARGSNYERATAAADHHREGTSTESMDWGGKEGGFGRQQDRTEISTNTIKITVTPQKQTYNLQAAQTLFLTNFSYCDTNAISSIALDIDGQKLSGTGIEIKLNTCNRKANQLQQSINVDILNILSFFQ